MITETLEELSKQRHDIVIIATDTAELARVKKHAHIQCGASTHALSVAAGMALEGKTPIVVLNHAEISAQLKFITENNLNVKILSLGKEIPRAITAIIPADARETNKALLAASIHKGPVWIHANKTPSKSEKPFSIGRAEIMRAGKDCTIIAAGNMLDHALEAAEKLAAREIDCTVLNCHTIPIDKHAIITSAKLTQSVVIADNTGALSAPVRELLSQNTPVPVKNTDGNSVHIMRAVSQSVMERCEASAERKDSHDLKPDFHFKLHGGGVLKTIPELQKALLTMSGETFSHHCTPHKNDFSTWVKEVFSEPALAKHIEQSKTPTGMALAIARWQT